MYQTDNLPGRVRDWITIEADTGCWRCGSAPTRGGYRQIRYQGRARRAHRLVYELLVGPIPAGHDLHHTCHVRACVNPAHLQPMTHAANVRERDLAGRTARGTANGRANMTPLDVLCLDVDRRDGHATFEELGEAYGVAPRTAGYAYARDIWAHVPREPDDVASPRGIVTMLSRGHSAAEVAEMFECSESSVQLIAEVA